MERAALTMVLLALTVLPPLATAPRHAGLAVTAPRASTALSSADNTLAPRVPTSPRVHAGAWVDAEPRAVGRFTDTILASGENARQPFIVIDKTAARLFVVDADGSLIGQAPVLLGAAHGDDSVPGIGNRPMAQIRPFERTTPAGRFLAAAGRNAGGEDVVWVDYAAAISMHRVRPVNPRERRLERLASPTPADNRISYGCINMPPAFFNRVVGPLFAKGPHLVYVLPEVKTIDEVFGARGMPRSG